MFGQGFDSPRLHESCKPLNFSGFFYIFKDRQNPKTSGHGSRISTHRGGLSRFLQIFYLSPVPRHEDRSHRAVFFLVWLRTRRSSFFVDPLFALFACRWSYSLLL